MKLRWIHYMLLFVPLAVVAEFLLHNDMLTFIFSALALVPLAGFLGEATEELSIHTGPKIGGLLNATLGNAAELIITIVALKAGKIELVKASLTGSIIGNLLLIIGFSFLLGGLKNGKQKFDRGLTGMSASLMTLAVIGLIIPTLFELLKEIADPNLALDVFKTQVDDPQLRAISIGVAAVLIIVYILSMIYILRDGDSGAVSHTGFEETDEIESHQANMSIKTAIGILVVCTLAIVFMSEALVGVVEPVARSLGVRELFLGIIFIPIVGNVAEHLVGVQAALKNKMDLSMTISLGSSTQIALFVAPLLVFISMLFDQQMTLFFSLFEVMVLGLSVIIATFVSMDGESNWLEGAMLLAVYIIVGIGFFFVG